MASRLANKPAHRLDKSANLPTYSQPETAKMLGVVCHTQQEIADAVGMSIGSVNAFTEKFRNGHLSDSENFRNLTPEVYTTWIKRPIGRLIISASRKPPRC